MYLKTVLYSDYVIVLLYLWKVKWKTSYLVVSDIFVWVENILLRNINGLFKKKECKLKGWTQKSVVRVF